MSPAATSTPPSSIDAAAIPAAVILVRPQHEGNIGAAARAMANMGLEHLHLVEPAPPLGATARALAVGAGHILEGARRHASLAEALAPFERVVGTTSGRNRQLEQKVISARDLRSVLQADPPAHLALVFGPEASGLTKDEVALLDPLVTIPCAARQPTLNLAQAVLLVAYELQLIAPEPADAASLTTRAATSGEIGQLLEHVEQVLIGIGFDRDDTYQGVLRDLRQMAARTRPSEREVQIFHGICRRTLHAIAAARRDSR